MLLQGYAALATAGAGILLTINLMAQTNLTIGPSPHDAVTVTALAETRETRTFDKAFNAETNGYRDLHVVIDNHSDRAIVAAVMEWHYTDAKGKTRGIILETDTWQRPHSGPNDKAEVVPAHSRTLFGPTATIPEALVGASGYAGSSIMPIQFTPFQGFTNPNFAIDLLVFSDGEMVGPDTKHYSTDFAARYSAGQRVVTAWKSGGVPAVQLLATGLFISPASADPQKQTESWITRYANQLGHTQAVYQSAYINYLANSPKPVALFRTN